MIDIPQEHRRLIGATLYQNGKEGKSFVIRPGKEYPKFRYLHASHYPYTNQDGRETGAKLVIVESKKTLWIPASDGLMNELHALAARAAEEKLPPGNRETGRNQTGGGGPLPDGAIMRGHDLHDPGKNGWKR